MFSELIEQTIKVNLTESVNGEIDDDVTYTSPKAVDEQKDMIVMNFEGQEAFVRTK